MIKFTLQLQHLGFVCHQGGDQFLLQCSDLSSDTQNIAETEIYCKRIPWIISQNCWNKFWKM